MRVVFRGTSLRPWDCDGPVVSRGICFLSDFWCRGHLLVFTKHDEHPFSWWWIYWFAFTFPLVYVPSDAIHLFLHPLRDRLFWPACPDVPSLLNMSCFRSFLLIMNTSVQLYKTSLLAVGGYGGPCPQTVILFPRLHRYLLPDNWTINRLVAYSAAACNAGKITPGHRGNEPTVPPLGRIFCPQMIGQLIARFSLHCGSSAVRLEPIEECVNGAGVFEPDRIDIPCIAILQYLRRMTVWYFDLRLMSLAEILANASPSEPIQDHPERPRRQRTFPPLAIVPESEASHSLWTTSDVGDLPDSSLFHYSCL